MTGKSLRMCTILCDHFSGSVTVSLAPQAEMKTVKEYRSSNNTRTLVLCQLDSTGPKPPSWKRPEII